MTHSPLHITAISGSVRKQSSNTHILKALASLFPEYIQVQFYDELESLPYFNPDPDKEHAPDAVQKLRTLLQASDAVIICTPEYAFGIPGVLKNALDWLVSSGELNEKPVAAITASPLTSGGDKAMASLVNTLTALGTLRNECVTLCIPAIKTAMNDTGKITSETLMQQLKEVSEQLIKLIESR
ncbi:MAG: NAD(P)H-dependent oxidoreductase [Cytophagales bacterium]|nr:NAD(P)H-dependent oxidoreductase [Cytophaga sp.]